LIKEGKNLNENQVKELIEIHCLRPEHQCSLYSQWHQTEWRRRTFSERNSATDQRQLWRRQLAITAKSFSILDWVMFAIPFELSCTALSFIFDRVATDDTKRTTRSSIARYHLWKDAFKSGRCFWSFSLSDLVY
jgi:hypothetical protein